MTKRQIRSIDQRINANVPAGTWYDLNDICNMINSPSKSVVKGVLWAMPNIQWRRVEHKNSPVKNPNSEKWKWQFKRIEDEI